MSIELSLEPSYEKPATVFRCCICGFEIYQGETYYTAESGQVCIDCTTPYLHSIRQVAQSEK